MAEHSGNAGAGGGARPHIREASEEKSLQARKAFDEHTAAEPKGPRPRADLLTLAATLAGQAMIGLGAVPNPVTKATTRDLGQARYSIDLLGVLEDKTRGNLSPEEERVLRSLVTDVRVRYVDAAREA